MNVTQWKSVFREIGRYDHFIVIFSLVKIKYELEGKELLSQWKDPLLDRIVSHFQYGCSTRIPPSVIGDMFQQINQVRPSDVTPSFILSIINTTIERVLQEWITLSGQMRCPCQTRQATTIYLDEFVPIDIYDHHE
jgi:hypothetical protein